MMTRSSVCGGVGAKLCPLPHLEVRETVGTSNLGVTPTCGLNGLTSPIGVLFTQSSQRAETSMPTSNDAKDLVVYFSFSRHPSCLSQEAAREIYIHIASRCQLRLRSVSMESGKRSQITREGNTRQRCKVKRKKTLRKAARTITELAHESIESATSTTQLRELDSEELTASSTRAVFRKL